MGCEKRYDAIIDPDTPSVMLKNTDTNRYPADRTLPPQHDTMGTVIHNNLSKGLPMKTWIKRTILSVFGLSLLVGGLAACSHRGHASGPMSEEKLTEMRSWFINRATKELELTEPQKQRLGVLVDKVAEQRKALVGKSTDPRAEALTIVAGTQFDRVKAQALLDEKTSVIRAQSPAVITAMADFYDSLTPTQQQRVRDMLQKHHHGWGHH